MSQNEINLLTRKTHLGKQLTTQPTIDIDEHEANNNTENQKIHEQLIKALVETENIKVKFQNTKNNVNVTNSYIPNSRMCFLM